jgi:hypothetical protein
MSDGGKGSSPRPFEVSHTEFSNSFEKIFGKKEPKPRWVPPPLPDDVVKTTAKDPGSKDQNQ